MLGDRPDELIATSMSPDLPRPRSGSLGQAEELALELFFFDMLAAGVYLARRGFIALSLVVGEVEESRLESAFAEFLGTRGDLLRAAGIGREPPGAGAGP